MIVTIIGDVELILVDSISLLTSDQLIGCMENMAFPLTAILGTFWCAIGLVGTWAQVVSAPDSIWIIADGVRKADVVGL